MDGADNAIFFLTRDAARIFGGLIRRWTLDPSCRPQPQTESRPGGAIISREVFVSAMTDAGLTEGADYLLRQDVRTVEIMEWRRENLPLQLPEAHVLQGIGESPERGLHIADVYGNLARHDGARIETQRPEPGKDKQGKNRPAAAMRVVFESDDDAFEEFLDEHMCAYTVSQCL